jgi:UDP-galactopyranose mutase
MPERFDYLIVGAGFAGAVLAERLSSQLGKSCLVVERRDHIGGNAYDFHDRAGVLLHRYGPHYFRTDSDSIKNYLSELTEWHPVEYKIRSWTHGRFWQFPINLNIFEQLLGRSSTTEEMEGNCLARIKAQTGYRWRLNDLPAKPSNIDFTTASFCP